MQQSKEPQLRKELRLHKEEPLLNRQAQAALTLSKQHKAAITPTSSTPTHRMTKPWTMATAMRNVRSTRATQAHREAITKEMNSFIKESTDNQGDAWGIIGNIISQKIVGVVVDNLIEVDNYGVCSVGSITFKGKTHRVSFGILGHVFTFDADDIQRALENGGDAFDIFHSPLNNPGNNDSSSDDGSTDDGSTDDGSSDNGSSTDDGGSSYDQQDGSADDGQSDGSSDSNEADGSDMSNM